MKKVSYILLVICLSVFIGMQKVSASKLGGYVYFNNSSRGDYADSINLFEATAEYNGFIEFLYNHNNDLVDYLFNYYGISSELYSSDYDLSIFGIGDFTFFSENLVMASGSRIDYDFSDKAVDTLIFSDDTFEYGSYGQIFKYYNVGRDIIDVDYIVMYSFDTIGYAGADYLKLSTQPKFLFLFNSAGVPVGYILFGNKSSSANYCDSGLGCGSNVIYNFKFDFTSDNPDITSWFGYLYKVDKDDFSSIYDTIYAFKFFDNGKSFSIDNNAGYTGVQTWFDGWFYKNVDMNIWNLNFVYDDVFYSKNKDFKSLYYYWHLDFSEVVPDSFSGSINIDDYEKGYYFVPKSGCSISDYKIYYTSETSVSAYPMLFGFYKLENEILNNISNYQVYSSKAYAFYSYQPILDLNVSVEDYLNYTFNVYLKNLSFFYKVYYNTSCYYVYSTVSDVNLDFDSGTYNLSSQVINDNFQNNTVNGSYSSNIKYNNSSNTSNNSNASSNSSSDIISDLSFGSIISNIGTYASNFASSISALVGLASIFLLGLPAEIYQILIAIFTIGVIIMLIKLFH